MTTVLRTLLIVEVPAADSAVARHRVTTDRSAAQGVAAHITVLFPFLPFDAVDDAVRGRLRSMVAAVPAFAFTLDRTSWFGSRVLWVAPTPDEPFRRLTGLMAGGFPEFPSYGGEFDDVVPRLTAADHADPNAMRRANVDVQSRLPIRADAATVTVLAEQVSGRWRRVRRFPLAAR